MNLRLSTRHGKPYMGCIVKDPLHLTGNAIYPPNVADYSTDCMLIEDVAWDVIDREHIVTLAHHTDKYFHIWKHKAAPDKPHEYTRNAGTFSTIAELSIIPEHCVIMHRNKDLSVIDRLRERKSTTERIIHPSPGPDGVDGAGPAKPAKDVGVVCSDLPTPLHRPRGKRIPFKRGWKGHPVKV